MSRAAKQKRRVQTLAQAMAEVKYPVPQAGDRFLCDPLTDRYETVRRFIREGTDANARTFTVTNEDRTLRWIRWAGTQWVDAILHVDCGGYEGERAVWAKHSTHRTDITAMDVLGDEAFGYEGVA